jgi:ABC-2 type transport system ATP-binding protein
MVIDGGRVIAEGTADELKRRLGNTIIEVRLADAAAAERARSRLEAIGGAEVLDDGRTVALTVGDAGRAVLEVVRTLDAGGVTPEWLTVREPTLDDVFLQLTGRKAEADGATADAAPAGGGRGRKRGAA